MPLRVLGVVVVGDLDRDAALARLVAHDAGHDPVGHQPRLPGDGDDRADVALAVGPVAPEPGAGTTGCRRWGRRRRVRARWRWWRACAGGIRSARERRMKRPPRSRPRSSRRSISRRSASATPGRSPASTSCAPRSAGRCPRRACRREQVVEELARGAAPGLVASPGPRYFGFVTGGALPAALAADWLTSAWDQNSFSARLLARRRGGRGGRVRLAARLLGLPAECGVGLTTGAQMANVTGLAAARHALLARAGWDVEERGLQRRAAAHGVRRRGGARDAVAGAAAARARARARRGRAGRRPGRDARRRARRPAPSTARRSCARRRATSTPARSTRSRRSPPPRASTARGCTSTAPSACGPPRARALAHLVAGRRRLPTRGRPTATSGSTSPTTAASSRSATPPPTPPRSTAGRGNTSLRKRIQFDLYYITHWTPLLDIRILWMTGPARLVNRNAY